MADGILGSVTIVTVVFSFPLPLEGFENVFLIKYWITI